MARQKYDEANTVDRMLAAPTGAIYAYPRGAPHNFMVMLAARHNRYDLKLVDEHEHAFHVLYGLYSPEDKGRAVVFDRSCIAP